MAGKTREMHEMFEKDDVMQLKSGGPTGFQ